MKKALINLALILASCKTPYETLDITKQPYLKRFDNSSTLKLENITENHFFRVYAENESVATVGLLYGSPPYGEYAQITCFSGEIVAKQHSNAPNQILLELREQQMIVDKQGDIRNTQQDKIGFFKRGKENIEIYDSFKNLLYYVKFHPEYSEIKVIEPSKEIPRESAVIIAINELIRNSE